MLAWVLVAGSAGAQVLPGVDYYAQQEYLNTHPWSPPVSDQLLDIPGVDLPVSAGPVDPLRVCRFDDGLLPGQPVELDVLVCKFPVDLDLACKTLWSNVARVPLVGPGIVANVTQTTIATDAAVNETIANQPDVPFIEDTQEGLRNLSWDRTSNQALMACRGATQNLTGLLGVDKSTAFIATANPDVCPLYPLIPVCEHDVPVGRTLYNETQDIRAPLATNACAFDGLIVDCGNVTVTDDVSVNPLAPTHDVVRQVVPYVAVHREINEHDVTTPGANQTAAEARSGDGACSVGGVSSSQGDNSVIPVVYTTLRIRGGAGAFQRLGGAINENLSLVFGAYNEALQNVSKAWNETDAELWDSVRDAWGSEPFTVLHTTGNGTGPVESACEPPDPSLETSGGPAAGQRGGLDAPHASAAGPAGAAAGALPPGAVARLLEAALAALRSLWEAGATFAGLGGGAGGAALLAALVGIPAALVMNARRPSRGGNGGEP